jgi:hypothetical protein
MRMTMTRQNAKNQKQSYAQKMINKSHWGTVSFFDLSIERTSAALKNHTPLSHANLPGCCKRG